MNRASFEEGEGELSLLVVGAWGPLLVVWGTQLLPQSALPCCQQPGPTR